MPQRKNLILSLSKYAQSFCSKLFEPSIKRACIASALVLIALCWTSTARAETVKVGISKLLGYPGVPIALTRVYFKIAGR